MIETGSTTLDVLLGGYKEGIYALSGEQGTMKTLLVHRAMSLNTSTQNILFDLSRDGTSLLDMWGGQNNNNILFIENHYYADIIWAISTISERCLIGIDSFSQVGTSKEDTLLDDENPLDRHKALASLVDAMKECVSRSGSTFLVTCEVRSGMDGHTTFANASLFSAQNLILLKKTKDGAQVELGGCLPPGNTGLIRLYQEEERYVDIDHVFEMMDWCLATGVVRKQGNLYYYGHELLGRSLRQSLNSMTCMMDVLKQKMRSV